MNADALPCEVNLSRSEMLPSATQCAAAPARRRAARHGVLVDL
jgi:hypothetical protein